MAKGFSVALQRTITNLTKILKLEKGYTLFFYMEETEKKSKKTRRFIFVGKAQTGKKEAKQKMTMELANKALQKRDPKCARFSSKSKLSYGVFKKIKKKRLEVKIFGGEAVLLCS